jgi:peptidoglycan LD-endopeptidase CwlK
MSKYSNTSKSRLATCHEDLQTLFNEVIKYYDCTIVCGHRGEIAQNEAYAAGNSEKPWPLSKHNKWPSLAVDAAPFEKTAIDWGKLQSSNFAGFVMGVAEMLFAEGKITHHIRSGADWDMDDDVDDTKFWDACHFEIVE